MSDGFLTTHILDTASGLPAAGVRITLFRLAEDGGREALAEMTTNEDGRTDSPILPAGAFQRGRYELIFHAGDYLRGKFGAAAGDFLDQVPVRFGIEDAGAHYHVPLLLSPYGYSTYRGS